MVRIIIKIEDTKNAKINSIFAAIVSISRDLNGNKKENYHNLYDNSLEVESERRTSNFLEEDLELINSVLEDIQLKK